MAKKPQIIELETGRSAVEKSRKEQRMSLATKAFTRSQITVMESQFDKLKEQGLLSSAKIRPITNGQAAVMMEGTVNGHPLSMVFYKFGNLEPGSYRGTLNGDEIITGPYFANVFLQLVHEGGKAANSDAYKEPLKAPVVELD